MKKDAGATRDWQATRRDLIYLFGVTTRTTSKWEDEGMPVAVRGGPGVASLYDLREVIAWIRRRDKGSSGTIDLTRERARRERAQAVLNEQRIEKNAGRLLDVDDVRETWAGQVSAIRTGLLAVPQAVSAQVVRVAKSGGSAAVQKLLTGTMHDVLAELVE